MFFANRKSYQVLISSLLDVRGEVRRDGAIVTKWSKATGASLAANYATSEQLTTQDGRQ